MSGRSALIIEGIKGPEGPIKFANIKPDGSLEREGSISTQQLHKMALVCSNKPNYPLHIDRLFSAGGNTRSALETLLAYTPHFFICHPERVDAYSGEILRNLKHIMWCPDETHPLGQIVEKEYKQVITEVELGIDFDQITIGNFRPSDEFDDIEVKRTHTQMQIALIEIGRALNFRTWVAKNDRSIQVGDKTMGDMEGVIPSLESMTILHNPESKEVAKLIDCIWFTADGRRIPAGIEVEHSTGVTSGLTRMLKLRETIPAISTTFTIVAPNDLRNKVVAEANQTIFRELKARYMPYTTVRELYGLVQRYSLSNVVDHKFIYPFMEEVVED